MKRGLSFSCRVFAVAVVLSAQSLASHPAWSQMPKALKAGVTFRECADCPEMVVIPPGTFTMGSPPSDAERKDLEEPQHRVTVARHFAMARYPVTRAEYQPFAVLTMCRAVYVLHQGAIVSKPAAARWAIAALPERWRSLIQQAAAWQPGEEMGRVDEIVELIRYAVAQADSLEKLLRGITKDNLHDEQDFGGPVGRDAW